MASSVRVTININDRRALRLVNTTTDECAKRAAHHAQRRAKAGIVAAGRVRTGAMLASIRVKKMRNPSPLSSSYRVGSDLKYTVYQERGVRAVHARPGGVLVFKPKGVNSFVFARSTKGFPGAHFMRDAVRSLTVSSFVR
jgi:hypothetical protein